MSLQETPLSSALSALSLNIPRVAVDVTINSDEKGIKSLLANFLIGAKLFGKIKHRNNGITMVTIQGHPKQFPSSLDYLKGLLMIKYDAAMVWGELNTVEPQNRLDSVIIEETVLALKRNPSSGEFLEQEVDEISFGGSAGTEQFKKVAQSITQSMLTKFSAFGRSTGLVAVSKKEHITVHYEKQSFDFEISSFLSLDILIQEVQRKFKLPIPIKKLYRLDNYFKVVVTDISDLRQDFLYYISTVNEVEEKDLIIDRKMQAFYKKLKTEEDMTEEQIEMTKTAFSSQGITFKQLMKTGKLAITDEKLEKYGIVQGGLRTAILSVIDNLKN